MRYQCLFGVKRGKCLLLWTLQLEMYSKAQAMAESLCVTAVIGSRTVGSLCRYHTAELVYALWIGGTGNLENRGNFWGQLFLVQDMSLHTTMEEVLHILIMVAPLDCNEYIICDDERFLKSASFSCRCKIAFETFKPKGRSAQWYWPKCVIDISFTWYFVYSRTCQNASFTSNFLKSLASWSFSRATSKVGRVYCSRCNASFRLGGSIHLLNLPFDLFTNAIWVYVTDAVGSVIGTRFVIKRFRHLDSDHIL